MAFLSGLVTSVDDAMPSWGAFITKQSVETFTSKPDDEHADCQGFKAKVGVRHRIPDEPVESPLWSSWGASTEGILPVPGFLHREFCATLPAVAPVRKGRTDEEWKSFIHSICADYLEDKIQPLLCHLQCMQEQAASKIGDLQSKIDNGPVGLSGALSTHAELTTLSQAKLSELTEEQHGKAFLHMSCEHHSNHRVDPEASNQFVYSIFDDGDICKNNTGDDAIPDEGCGNATTSGRACNVKKPKGMRHSHSSFLQLAAPVTATIASTASIQATVATLDQKVDELVAKPKPVSNIGISPMPAEPHASALVATGVSTDTVVALVGATDQQMGELTAKDVSNVDINSTRFEPLVGCSERTIDNISDHTDNDDTCLVDMHAELGLLRDALATLAEPTRKVQVVVAAAGLRFERQLSEIRQQIGTLTELLTGTNQGLATNWPGRVVNVDRALDEADCTSGDGNDLASEESTASPSSNPTLASASPSESPHETSDMKRLQAIVGAAGTVLSRDVHTMQQHLKQLGQEMHAIKRMLAESMDPPECN